jgi:hypothetical protein
MQTQASGILLFLLLASACVGDAATAPPPDAGPTDGDAAIANDATAPRTMTIPTLRNPAAPGHPALGDVVKVEGAIVTGVKTAGASRSFFIQDPSAKEWAAVYVYAGSAALTVEAGAIVSVTGTLSSFRGMSQIDITKGTVVTTGTANVPPPLDVTPNDIRAGAATADMYQSMVLRVKAVKAKTSTAGVDFIVTSAVGGDDLIITSFIAGDLGPSPFPATVGQTYTSIVGRGFKFGTTDQNAVAKLAPVSAVELVTP